MALSIRGIAHTNVNCSDLERSRRFYTEVAGLRAGAHTAPEQPQDCRAFGLDDKGQWDAWMLSAADDPQATALDLLEWKLPRPIGRPAAEPHALGFAQLGLEVPDLAALEARLGSARAVHSRAANGVRACDPDGTQLEFEQRSGRAARLAHLTVNCSDLERSLAWYRDVLGLETAAASISSAAREVAELFVPGRADGFRVRLAQWKQPRPVGSPAAQPHQLGIFRMAFLVDDAHAAYAALGARGARSTPPVWLEMGPEIPIDGLWALFFPDPDGACLELIQSPRVHSR